MGLTKGTRFTNPRVFVIERFGAEAWDALLTGMPSSDAAVVRTAVAASWYDDTLHGRVVRALCDHFGDGSLAVELGRFEAERDLTTVHRWFLRLVRPSFAVRNMNLYWCRFHDTGRWSSEVQGAKIRASLRDWNVTEPALCRFLQGYLGRMLEYFGTQEAIVLHPSCRARGEDHCEFHSSRFRADEWARRSVSPIVSGDLPNILSELAHLKDLGATGDAVLALLRDRLSFSYVALWSRMEPGSEMRLLRSSGTKGSGVSHCFVLQTGGCMVGRLEVESPPGREDAAILDRLVSCIAIALGSNGAPVESTTAPRSSEAPNSVHEISRRLAVAGQRWGLTPRQVEVLSLLVRGWTNKEIASELGCQEGTIEVHVSQALKKSGAANRAGLVARVLAEG